GGEGVEGAGGANPQDDVAWRRKILRWQNVRSREARGVPEEPRDQAGLTPTRRRLRELRARAAHAAGVILPPVLMIGLLGLLWQWLCSAPDASLPPPSKVLTDTHDLITQPFYDNRSEEHTSELQS